MTGRPLTGAVDRSGGARMTSDEFARLVLGKTIWDLAIHPKRFLDLVREAPRSGGGEGR